jgi:hypothetical protein
MRVLRWLFLLFVVAVFLNLHSTAWADDDVDDIDVDDVEDLKDDAKDDDYEYEEDDGVLRPHHDVRATVHFPDFPDRKFDLGARVNALIGFNNKGNHPFNVTAIGAFFHSPYDYSYYIQNFSYRDVGVILQGHWQVTFEYVFAPDKGLEPVEYWLSGWIDYNSSEGREYRSTWYNGTVTLVEKNAEFDIRKTFSYLFLLALLGLLIYFVVNYATLTGGKKKKERRPYTERSAAPKETTDADWGTIYKPAAQSRRVGSKKAPTKKTQSEKASKSPEPSKDS